MTPSGSPRATMPPGARQRWLSPTTLIALLLASLLALAVWAAANRPATMAGYAGRVGGLAFSPMRPGQTPESNTWPTDRQIEADLRLVAGRTHQIRTYSVQGVLGDIPRLARGTGLSVTAGAWLDRDTSANAAELSRLVSIANANPDVTQVMVGNETLLRRDLAPAALIADIDAVRRQVHVPVSTAEPWDQWLKHPELAHAVDFITIHLLPYWEGLPVDAALRYSINALAQVEAAYPGKRVVIGEIGWPSNGVEIGAARASRVNQAEFLRRFFVLAQAQHLDYFVMEAFDQPWKTSFEGRAAGYWGMYTLGRHPKWPMLGPVSEHPFWAEWAGGGIAAALLLAWGLLSRRPDLRLPPKLLLAGLAQGFCGSFALLLMTMAGTYLSMSAAAVWSALAAGQGLLLLLLLADGFELAETVWSTGLRRAPALAPAPQGARLPMVSIHLPICNEPPHMVRQTLDALARLDYPNFEVLVVDNNTADPALWQPVAAHCARLGGRFRFFHLGRWPGFKAGALNFALAETAPEAEIVGVLDSDYIVRPDWLRWLAPCFADPRVGFTQSPQDYRDNDGSFFKRLMFWEYAGFFQCGMVTRNERNAIIQHGTMTLIRRSALASLGGWSERTITEDAELGLRLFRAGWQAVYSPESFGRGVMPDDFAAFRKQRFRWAYGAAQICRMHARALFSPFNRELTTGQRWHFVTGWLPWLGDALGLAFLLAGLVWSALLIAFPVRFEFPIALFMLPSLGLFGFKLAQLAALYRSRVACGWADRAAAALAGLALTHTIGKAVWRGLFTDNVPFRRTPKMTHAPALVQGLVMAREETALLVLALAAAAGVAVVHHLATPESRLWCLVLLVQSLPYAASVAVSTAAAWPARQRVLRPARSTPARGALRTGATVRLSAQRID